MVSRSTDTGAFLGALHEGCEGVAEFRAFAGAKGAPSVGRIFCTPAEMTTITRFLTAHRTHDVYVGVATRRDDRDGKLENCRHLIALYVDIDFKVTPDADARARLARFPLPPSIIVRSGGGLHVYYLLREPFDLPNDAPIVYSLLRRLAHALAADLTAAEPARVLRVPGTFNCKPDYPSPRPVVVEILEPDRRYNPSDFDEILPPEPADTTAVGIFVLPERIPAHEPGRNHTLWRYGRSLKAKGWKLPRILAELERVNRERCEPPLPPDELGDVAHNVMTEADRPTFAARRNGDKAAPAAACWKAPADRPVIDTGNLGLAEMAAAAWQAIEGANDPPRVYRYAHALAWLADDPAGRPRIEVMQLDHVRHHLAHVVTFTRQTVGGRGRPPEIKPAFPPVPLAADLLAVPSGRLPVLQRLVHVPVFTAEGQLLTAPGYDAGSGIYFAPPAGLSVPAIAEQPTPDEIYAACSELVDELFVDFPFLTQADRAHAVALLLTPFVRELIADHVPLFVVSKPTPRTGAGLLVKAVSLVHTGSPIAATTVSRDEEEMRKRLTAFLIPSPMMILLDNLHGRLDSASLAAILTSVEWQDRPLGLTTNIFVPVRSLFVVTGNNVVLSSEIAGRSVMIRLDPKVEDPSTRAGFRHPALEAWVVEHRGRLLWAGLTLVRAWIAAGRPLAPVAFGGFQSWAGILGGVLSVAGIDGFLQNREDLFRRADEESANIRGFLAAWWDKHDTTAVPVKSLLEIAKEHALEISAKSDQGVLVRLGRLVQSLEDRPYNLGQGLEVAVRRGGEYKRAVLWRLSR